MQAGWLVGWLAGARDLASGWLVGWFLALAQNVTSGLHGSMRLGIVCLKHLRPAKCLNAWNAWPPAGWAPPFRSPACSGWAGLAERLAGLAGVDGWDGCRWLGSSHWGG